jgi:predicted nuclease with TOPRIM domain
MSINFDTDVVLNPPPSIMSEALLHVMSTWNGLPKDLCGEHFQNCMQACSRVYKIYRDLKRCISTVDDEKHHLLERVKELEDDNETMEQKMKDLEGENETLEQRIKELLIAVDETHSRGNERLEELQSQYNALRNRYRRLLGQSLHGIPQLRPIQPRSLQNDFVSASQVLPTRRRKRRVSELENLLD